MQTRESSRQALIELALPPAVLAIFDGEMERDILRFRCSPPLYWFSTRVDVPGGDIIPLWECGTVVTAYQAASGGRFIRVSLEAPDEVIVLGDNFAAVAVDLFVALWEDECTETELREVADAFEFRAIEQFLSDLVSCPAHFALGVYATWLGALRKRHGRTDGSGYNEN